MSKPNQSVEQEVDRPDETIHFEEVFVPKGPKQKDLVNELELNAVATALDLGVTPRFWEMRPDDVLRNTGLKSTPDVGRIAYKAVKLALSDVAPDVR